MGNARGQASRFGWQKRAEGRKPGRPALDRAKVRAALTLVRSGLSPTKAADQVGLGRSTVYRELALLTGATLPA